VDLYFVLVLEDVWHRVRVVYPVKQLYHTYMYICKEDTHDSLCYDEVMKVNATE